MPKASKCAVPPQCRLNPTLHSADFADAYQAANPQPARSAMAIWLDTVRRTPAWVERAMDARNAVVRRLGLKDLGNLSSFEPLKADHDYRVGDRVGIFTVRHIAVDEVILGDSDKHLDVALSLLKMDDGARVVVSTVVHVHNRLGHAYMALVKPMHRLIAPAVLSRI
ncbi:DUF2867 domain-containing protein [Ottowia sp.]|uniref:DUF2867 domain-containing protein n=1 Tax=Ottowia sp. TaxID=1898956 RepID=UPI003A866867